MKQVTREEFYKTINFENVSVTPVGSYPYETNFSLKNGRVMDIFKTLKIPI